MHCVSHALNEFLRLTRRCGFLELKPIGLTGKLAQLLFRWAMGIRVRTLLTWGIPEKNPLTTSFLASSKSYGSQRLSQINLVNQSLQELQNSGRDSNFFHLCWNVAFQVPKSLNTNYLLFVLTVFPAGRVSRGGKRFREKQWKHSPTAKTASIFS